MLKEFKKFINHVLKSKLLIFGFLIYFLFNISAFYTRWFDFFFFGSSIHHCCLGLDFYQIPNAAYAFFHGGELTGKLPPGIIQYSQNYITNSNVYHPLITIILGGFLIFFEPEISIRLWTIIKIFITIFTVYYIFKNFEHSKYLNLAIFLFLINFSTYNEIKISQYQFLFNIFLLYFLINLVKNKSSLEGAILFFLTLIAKPVSLLWVPVLIIKKKYYIAVTGILLFLVSTFTFKLIGIGDYYINNVTLHLLHPIPSRGIDFMSFDALLRNGFGISQESIKIFKFLILAGIYIVSIRKGFNILKTIFLLVIYFLFFYDLVFQYHFSILGPMLSLCLLVLPEFQTRISRFLIIVINLPTIFFIFKLLKFGIINSPILGIDPTYNTWKIVSIFQLLPIFLLTIIVLLPDIKYFLGKTKILKNVTN